MKKSILSKTATGAEIATELTAEDKAALEDACRKYVSAIEGVAERKAISHDQAVESVESVGGLLAAEYDFSRVALFDIGDDNLPVCPGELEAFLAVVRKHDGVDESAAAPAEMLMPKAPLSYALKYCHEELGVTPETFLSLSAAENEKLSLLGALKQISTSLSDSTTVTQKKPPGDYLN